MAGMSSGHETVSDVTQFEIYCSYLNINLLIMQKKLSCSVTIRS